MVLTLLFSYTVYIALGVEGFVLNLQRLVSNATVQIENNTIEHKLILLSTIIHLFKNQQVLLKIWHTGKNHSSIQFQTP